MNRDMVVQLVNEAQALLRLVKKGLDGRDALQASVEGIQAELTAVQSAVQLPDDISPKEGDAIQVMRNGKMHGSGRVIEVLEQVSPTSWKVTTLAAIGPVTISRAFDNQTIYEPGWRGDYNNGGQ